ncbi:MAG: 2-dehydropantoate 2-reductase [bacterium]|nr:2-dehydropantoate 2-reductase [bacterium]MDZ4285591.1 2-dehydropantoate 2-reductase [Candidatus Sungbacteria bacterium]
MITKLSSIAILGPGGIGGFLAAAFEKAGFPVTCVATEDGVERINKNGIHVESLLLGTFTARPRAVASLDRAPSALFITTKAASLEDAIKRIDPEMVQGAIIIPLLNGIEHMEILRKRFPGQVAAGTISIESYEAAPGRIVHTTPFAKIRVAADESGLNGHLADAARLIAETGITSEVGTGEMQILWEKLVRLNALALMTSRYKKPIGEIRDNEQMRNELSALVNEAVSVAQRQGAIIDATEVLTHIDRLESGQFSSLKRDIDQGKISELDAIAGAVMRRGMRYYISCPTINEFIEALRRN